MQKTELLCFGNAVVDIFGSIDRNLMNSFGIREPVQHIDSGQVRGVLSSPGTYTRGSGGGAANAAKIAALLGIRAAFAGCAGCDEAGDFFESELSAAGVVPLLKRVKSPTGTCLVLRDGEETRIAACPAAALELDADDVDEAAIRAAALVVIDGYMLARRALVRRILRTAGQAGIPVALDAASVFITRNHAGEIARWCEDFPLVLFMNADECIAFYHAVKKAAPEKKTQSESEKEEMILREVCPVLRDMAAGEFPVIVVKLGSRGALAVSGGKIYRGETNAIKPKNTTGAGDALCAAFLAARLRGKSLQECLALGNGVAGLTLAVEGTGLGAESLATYARALQSKTD